MKRRHSSLGNTSLKTITHDKLIAFTKLFKERHKVKKIIAVVRITHDNILSFCRLTATYKCCAIATLCNRNNSCSRLHGNLAGTVRAPVICDKHLSVNIILSQKGLCLFYTRLQCLRLVKTGHENGQFILVGHNNVSYSFLF